MTHKITLTSLYSFLLLIAGFILFWEWLRPLEKVTDTGNLDLFVLFTAICFLASFWNSNKIASFLVKFCAMVFILDYLFIEPFILSNEWIHLVLLEMTNNITSLFDKNWFAITDFFRSFLFLLLLWLMSYLLHFWFIVANKFFLFVLLTLVYLAVLDTFTIYDAQIPMVRTFILSFIMLGVSRYVKIEQLVDRTNRKSGIYWMTAVLFFVALITIIGWISPKPNPQWPDPVPFIQSTAGHIGFSGEPVQKVGYGEDDSQLGGSFIQDDSIVFEAITPETGYWRIESKDVYTGKGWERSTELAYEQLTDGIISWERLMGSSTKDVENEAIIQPHKNNQLEKAVYPYGSQHIASSNEAAFYMDEQAGMIEYEGLEQNDLLSYTISYNPLSFSIHELKNSPEQDLDDMRERYLQLPDQLPNRVRELSAEIVEGQDTRYDKVKKIESYFSANGYEYQIEDVSIPEDGEDYVDQFLFETMVGYCDNFSTSMVVMLRSLDIPARWVKGFTGGQLSDSQPELLPDEYSLYEVSNNNAHSWVEVYFPGSGWVPFEPTSGFSNPTDFYQETSAEFGNEETDIEQTESEQIEEIEEPEEEIAEQEESIKPTVEREKDNNNQIFLILSIVIILAVSAIMLFRKRKQMNDWFARTKWNRIANKFELENAYLYITELLEKRGFKRKKGQTLRQYAKEVDNELGTTEMYELTTYYEQFLYHQKDKQEKTKRIQILSQRMIDQILA